MSLISFNPDYRICTACGTLVSQSGLSVEQLQVGNDETDFYGKQYWLEHQNNDLGLPDIHARARNDLTERNLHWLKTLLKYRLPPAKVLELGCSHGSFVALLRQAGYDAVGVEMSPWVVEFGQKTFGVPISVGPVEALALTSGSLDVIALMDVLEHLPDPVATMAHCLQLLKPDGILLIQTPQFKEEMDYAALVDTNAPFLKMMIPDEHLYLFSERSVAGLFEQLGAEHIQFEPAIFGHYDMFFLVSRSPIVPLPAEKTESAFSTPQGRFVQALLDMDQRIKTVSDMVHELQQAAQTMAEHVEVIEADRAARLEQIHTLTDMVHELQAAQTKKGTR